MIAFLAVAGVSFAAGALVAYKLSGVAASPSPVTPDVVSMREWQQGMDALRRADVPKCGHGECVDAHGHSDGCIVMGDE